MQLDVTPEEAGKRVDLVLAHRTGAARSQIAQAAREGRLRINGSPVKGSAIVNEGDLIDCDLPPPPHELAAEPEAIDIPIVYEDDDIIVVDKPAGMVTHPARSATSGTLVNALLAHVGDLPWESSYSDLGHARRSHGTSALPEVPPNIGPPHAESFSSSATSEYPRSEYELSQGKLRAGLIHRLDRDTSGLLLVAKTPEAMSFLTKGMKARHIKREYLGLVQGIPVHDRGTIDGPIGRDSHNRLRFAIVADGKPAVTHYEIRERLHDAAELLFRLETGRTHQIRVHMAAMGHPIINDPVYGKTDKRFDLPGQALHAWRLEFMHPRTHELMRFEVAPPPEYVAAKAMLASVS